MLHDGVFLFVYIVSHVCESKGGLYVNVKLHFLMKPPLHYFEILEQGIKDQYNKYSIRLD